jgi:3-dehydroquinate synthase
MPAFVVKTRQRTYSAVVARGVLDALAEHVPPSAGRLFVVTTEDVWGFHGAAVSAALKHHSHKVLFFPGGEERKRLAEVERLAEEMVREGADRSSLVVAFGGGIVNDVGGFLAASFMRGVPVLQVPTTLLAQVDAAIGGKTGVNLVSGKNLFGAFHQPVAVLIDPDVLRTLPEREYRAGLYEVLKTGVILSSGLFRLMAEHSEQVLAQEPEVVEEMIAESVRIKTEVVSADERESDLRRILNFGHTIGHALEAETAYSRFLHGEAVAFGMRAATHLAHLTGRLSADDSVEILDAITLYGPIPGLNGLSAESLVARLGSDKKTVGGKVHFVLPERIGQVAIVSGVDDKIVLEATRSALG